MNEAGLAAQGRNQWLELQAEKALEGLTSSEKELLAELYLRRFQPWVAARGRSHGTDYLAKSELIVRLRYGH